MKERPTVLVINTFAPPPYLGGAERTVEQFCTHLRDSGYQVVVLGLLPPGAQPEREVRENIEYLRLPILNSYWPWAEERNRSALRSLSWQLRDLFSVRTMVRTRQLIRDVNPAVIITHNLRGWTTAPWSLARRAEIPLIHVIHDYGMTCFKSTRFKHGSICHDTCFSCKPRQITSRAFFHGQAVVGVSHYVLNRHIELGIFAEKPRFVIYPKVDPGVTRIVSAPRDELAIGYLGRVGMEKGVDLLAQAAHSLGVKVHIAGYVTTHEKAELLAINPNLDFLGVVDAAKFLSSIDVLIAPSLWEEPFGRIVTEAALQGTRVVISSDCGLHEAAALSGAEWVSFKRGDLDSLVSTLRSVLAGESHWRSGGEIMDNCTIVDVVERVLGDI